MPPPVNPTSPTLPIHPPHSLSQPPSVSLPPCLPSPPPRRRRRCALPNNQISGAIIAPVSICFMLYALHLFRKRTRQILSRSTLRYDDQRGPVLLTLLLVGVTLVCIVLALQAFRLSSGSAASAAAAPSAAGVASGNGGGGHHHLGNASGGASPGGASPAGFLG